MKAHPTHAGPSRPGRAAPGQPAAAPIDRRELMRRASILGLGALALPRPRTPRPPAPFPELEVRGSRRAIGRAHGEAFAERIRRNADFYTSWLAASTGSSRERVLELASLFAPVIERHLPAQLEEMEGIAAGSGRSLEEILAINARSDLLTLGRREEPEGDKPGCTALALSGSSGRAPLLALGQNWDWKPELAGNTVLLRVRPSSGPDLVTLTEAGMVGKIGFNQHRLGVCLNFLSHPADDPEGPVGVPVHCLLRGVMECSSLEEAVKLVSWAPRCASANFLMARAGREGPRALDLEWTSAAVGRLPMREGVLVHTNHFKNPCFPSREEESSTWGRDRLATDLARRLREELPDPVERMQRILSSCAEEPYPISRPTTLAGVVMDLSRNRIHLVAGQPHRRSWEARPGV